MLQGAKEKPLSREVFLKRMEAELRLEPGESRKAYRGGAPTQETYDPLMSDEGSETSVEIVPQPKRSRTENVVRKSVVDKNVAQVKSFLETQLPQANKRDIGYYMVATALANVGSGGKRSLTVNSIGTQVYRKGLGKVKGPSIGQVMQLLGCHTQEWNGLSSGIRFPTGVDDAIYITSGRGSRLPESIGEWAYRLGATTMEGVTTRYALVSSPGDASVGVYLPRKKTTYVHIHDRSDSTHSVDETQPLARPSSTEVVLPKEKIVGTATNRRAEIGAKRRPQKERMQESLCEVLASAPKKYLNARDSPEWRLATCPRLWNLHRWRPPHVSKLAWEGIAPHMRLTHIRCLQKLMSMPQSYMSWGIASLAIECVRRDAAARGWKASTVAKELAVMAGALRDLPLYTTEASGILLQSNPEWKAAQRAIRRLETESDPAAVVPISQEQCMAALSGLRRDHPDAAVYLSVMWTLAARAGDVDGLRKCDVVIQPTADPERYRISVVQKFGKGARFRGVYYQEATLDRWSASRLKGMMGSGEPTQRLFGRCLELREIVRRALRKQNKDAALPSIRRGAIRQLASDGVPQAKLMELMGHRRVETLRRYLGLGHHMM